MSSADFHRLYIPVRLNNWLIEPLLKGLRKKIARIFSKDDLFPALDVCCGPIPSTKATAPSLWAASPGENGERIGHFSIYPCQKVARRFPANDKSIRCDLPLVTHS